MDPHIKIDAFLDAYAEMPKNVFLTRFYHPVLIVSMVALGVDEDGTARGAAGWPFSKSTIMEGNSSGTTSVVTRVIPLEKGESGMGSQISIGRGRENDVVILNPSVSRRHALIDLEGPSGQATLTDAGSSYGTTLNGAGLQAKAAYPLESGAVIVMGQSAHCTFLTPPDLYDYMKALLRIRGK
ncbi:MAG: FHA domain-containing protein [Planctomycetota bacterium]|jgi:hypothetical protein